MFDIGADELLVIAVVAVVVIGPKDLPRALRLAGRWIAKVRRISGHFRSGLEAMIREAELEEMESKWREQNEAIMRAHPPETIAQPSQQALPQPEAAALPAHAFDPPPASPEPAVSSESAGPHHPGEPPVPASRP